MNEMKTLFRTLVGLLEILALLMVIPAASLFIHCVRQADPSNTSNPEQTRTVVNGQGP